MGQSECGCKNCWLAKSSRRLLEMRLKNPVERGFGDFWAYAAPREGAVGRFQRKRRFQCKFWRAGALRLDLGVMTLTKASRPSPAGELPLKRERTEIFVHSLAASAPSVGALPKRRKSIQLPLAPHSGVHERCLRRLALNSKGWRHASSIDSLGRIEKRSSSRRVATARLTEMTSRRDAPTATKSMGNAAMGSIAMIALPCVPPAGQPVAAIARSRDG